MDQVRSHILQKHGIVPEARVSAGMEAEVYAYGPDAVLKLYDGTARLADLRILQSFYESLDRQRVPYALPRIQMVAEQGAFVVTVEQRLAGDPMAVLLPSCTGAQLDTFMRRYLEAALALAKVPAPSTFDRYKLFDPEGMSTRASGDWHQFLARFLDHKLAQVAPYLRRDVPQLESRVQVLRRLLAQPYQSTLHLIHGDFFPGNLLVNTEGEITALLDFGLLTMYGDPLFDLATGWVFFDMYDELKAEVRERYLAMLLERLGEGARGRLYRYVLLYSVLSANTYSPTCSDGHYQWCVANLRSEQYWEAIE